MENFESFRFQTFGASEVISLVIESKYNNIAETESDRHLDAIYTNKGHEYFTSEYKDRNRLSTIYIHPDAFLVQKLGSHSYFLIWYSSYLTIHTFPTLPTWYFRYVSVLVC